MSQQINIPIGSADWQKFKILAISKNTTMQDLLATMIVREVNEAENAPMRFNEDDGR